MNMLIYGLLCRPMVLRTFNLWSIRKKDYNDDDANNEEVEGRTSAKLNY